MTTQTFATLRETLLSRGFRQRYCDAHFRVLTSGLTQCAIPDAKLTSALIEEANYRSVARKAYRRRYAVRLLRDPTFASSVTVSIYSETGSAPAGLDEYDLRVRASLLEALRGRAYGAFTPHQARDDLGPHWFYSLEPKRRISRATIVSLCRAFRQSPYRFGVLTVHLAFGWLESHDLRESGLPPRSLVFAAGGFARDAEEDGEFLWETGKPLHVSGGARFRSVVAQAVSSHTKGDTVTMNS